MTGSLARSDSKETHVSCHKRAKHASQFSRVPIPCYNSFDGKSNADQDYEADSDFQTMAPGIRALRAKAIENSDSKNGIKKRARKKNNKVLWLF